LTGAFIEAIDVALPERVITNADLDAMHPAWRMDEVAKRTGVLSRRWCGPSETALTLGVAASRKLLEKTDTNPTSIGAILFCTQTPDFVMPPNACMLQAQLGVSQSCAALDFSLACSGFVYGLYLAKAIIESNQAEKVLLVTADSYSKLFSHEDRGPATLFGDGAAATLISRGESVVSRVLLGTDGSNPQVFCVPAGGARRPRDAESGQMKADAFGNMKSDEHISMNGAAVLAFVQRDLIPFVTKAMTELDVSMDDIDLVVCHQASLAALEIFEARLRIPKEKMFIEMEDVGNTVSASIPIALLAAEESGKLQKGMKVLLVGFGVGLSWGACVITW